MDLTEKQKKIYNFIHTYQQQHGFPPSQRELASALGIERATTREYLNALEKKGYITRNNSRRMIEIPAHLDGIVCK